MDYHVYDPTYELQGFVKCFWTLEDEAHTQLVPQRVVPDGCMEMIIHYGDLYQQILEDGTTFIQPRSFIFGQITSYIEIAPTGKSGIVAARFLPDGLAPFLDVPIASLENKAVALTRLFGEKALTLEQQVNLSLNNIERIHYIEEFLLSHIGEQQQIDNITKSCVDAIVRSQGQLAMTELADKVNSHRRQIERRFNEAVGMSPKQLSRVVRLQATIKMMGQKKFVSLTSLALENGYYDQAHFIKDFREFTGLSPKSFFAANLQFAALFASAE